MLKQIRFAKVVEVASRNMVIHEALGFAILQNNGKIRGACERLLRNLPGYDPTKDWDDIIAFLHPQAVSA